jgi:CTP synthase (UTP-ammonia lyase)
MNGTVKLGIIGAYDEKKTSHPATMRAIEHASEYLSLTVKTDWLPTPSFLTDQGIKALAEYDAIWASSGSPYRSLEGALNAIRAAREMKRPFIGT